MGKVFISYSHDSEDHREKVLALSERLRDDGIETLLDQYVNGSPSQGWPRWMMDQLDAADFVLVVCTETYYRRFCGQEEPGKGKGVDWEGALITQEIYDARSKTLKFVPVLLARANEDWVPEPLRSATSYTLTSQNGYECLYDFLLGLAGIEARPVGMVKKRERRKGTPLSFAGENDKAASEAHVDISRILKYAPDDLIGRDDELKLLNAAWSGDIATPISIQSSPFTFRCRPHILTIVALGGEGKTSLVAKWAVNDMLAKGWRGCDAAFAWSFYSQGTRGQMAASSDLFLKEALAFFGDEADIAGGQQGVSPGH